jgi:hypothetical protein
MKDSSLYPDYIAELKRQRVRHTLDRWKKEFAGVVFARGRLNTAAHPLWIAYYEQELWMSRDFMRLAFKQYIQRKCELEAYILEHSIILEHSK